MRYVVEIKFELEAANDDVADNLAWDFREAILRHDAVPDLHYPYTLRVVPEGRLGDDEVDLPTEAMVNDWNIHNDHQENA